MFHVFLTKIIISGTGAKEEEEKAQEVELTANDEKEAESIPELLEVKERLDELEETERNSGCVKEAIRQCACERSGRW